MKWEPIETAPKDGTSVLLGYLDKSGRFAVKSARFELITAFPRKEGPWSAWVCTMDPCLVCQRATHWMPLPAPPTLEKE